MPDTLLSLALLRHRAERIRPHVLLPDAALLQLPERAVQFGTGAFLRGFIEYFIDRANRAGLFQGRIVAVDSTGSGRAAALNAQDGLFTLAVQGRENGATVRSARVIASLSRVLSARDQWSDVLTLARSADLQLIFSNTTEAGIALDPTDSPDALPPHSFPAKLTRFLFERARHFEYAQAAAPVVIPCELIEDNGARLRELVLRLARAWNLGEAFEHWLERVQFCNTLVDRIVPGTPAAPALDAMCAELGYRDTQLTVAEPYRLFAIEGDAALRARLQFADADACITITPTVAPYRERKVRLLNGAHTLVAPAALLCGCTTVLEAVQHPQVGPLVRQLLLEELVQGTAVPGAAEFAGAVLERFANPFVRHNLTDITLQQTTKFRVRVVPTLLGHAAQGKGIPEGLTRGFAALLQLLRAGPAERPDDAGETIRALWREHSPADAAGHARFARTVCANRELWGEDLSRFDGLADRLGDHLYLAAQRGFPAVLGALLPAGAR